MTENNDTDIIAILQNNLRKNQSRTHSILNDPSSSKYTMLILQEQYWSDITESSPINGSWTLIESKSYPNRKPRSAIYINNHILDTSAFRIITIPLPDVTAVAINTINNPKPTMIINIYNPGDENLITPLMEYLQQNIDPSQYHAIIIAGDFNLHHPLWNPPQYHIRDPQADELIEGMLQQGMQLMIPPGTITFPDAKTAIDLVWGNEHAMNSIIKCHIATENDHGSDHLPIETILDLTPRLTTPTQSPYNFTKTDWKTLKIKLQEYLPPIPERNTFTTEEAIDNFAANITNAINKAIAETTPRKKPSPFSKRWWNEELTRFRKELNQVRNRHKRTHSYIDWMEWKKKRNEYNQKIRNAKYNTWKKLAETADEKSIWILKNYMNSKPTQHYIPTLNETATTNEEKTNQFRKVLLPTLSSLPPANTSDITATHTYPEPTPFNPTITKHQLERAIAKLAPDKAPGLDEITNRILKKNFGSLQTHLLTLAQACIDTGHFPSIYKKTLTIVLRKPNKPDYTKPNAYRPIALECTIGKLLESIVTELLSYLIETHDLLPANHFGARPQRTTEDAMMVLSENIYRAWKQQEIFTVIFMDVAGAFNNVHHNRLIHNMKQRRIPLQIVRLVQSFLTERSTQMRFNGATSSDINIEAGIPQGSPLSPILFMLYNAELLEIPRPPDLALGFIDDIAYGISGQTAQNNIERLQTILSKSEEWKEKHGAQFEPSKYMLIHFTRNTNHDVSAGIQINDTTISPGNEARYLGVIFDQKLKFHAHLDYATKKGTKFALALSSIARITWGTPFKYIRRLYTAVIRPRIQYGAAIWHRPEDTRNSPATTQASNLTSVQRLAMKTITGCFKTTSTTALQHETELLPIELELRKQITKYLTRVQTLPIKHPMKIWLLKAVRYWKIIKNPTFPSNLEYLVKQYPDYIKETMEEIHPYIKPPWWSLTNISTHIANIPKDKAKEEHQKLLKDNNTPNILHIYTDGSGIESHIGAAAYSPTISASTHQYLGKADTANVYTAELTAIQLGINMAAKSHEQYDKCFIYVDNQSSIQAIEKPKQQSGQYIIRNILQSLEELQNRRPNLEFKIEWVPGHMDITGNEKADEEAKRAALEQLTEESFTQYKLKSVQITKINDDINTVAKKAWNNGKTNARQHRKITRPRRFKTGVQLYGELPRKKLANLIRLRTGHCRLNSYLNRCNIIEDPSCDCGHGIENVKHFLLLCKKYEEARKELRKKVGGRNMRMENLLGDPKLIKDTLEYVEKTGRFNFV
jgi:ribonuclease HI